MKEYKPTLKLVKNKWYVSMTVPFELRYILTNQIRLSTSTSDKNEALKHLPELAIELKQKIIDAIEQLKTDALKEKVLSIATKLNRQDSININTLDKHSLIALLEELSQTGKDEINFGTFNVKNLRLDVEKLNLSRNRIDRKEVRKAKQLLTEIKGVNNSFKQLADEWLKVNRWNREKSRKAFISHIDKFLEVIGDVDLKKITKVMLYDFSETMAVENNSSNQTIKNYIASIRAVLNYAERKGKIDSSPAYNLNLETYGTSKKERKPFPFDMAKELFKLELPKDIRLLWSIMISTGMRLDEAALLSLKNIKEERQIRYFDLTRMKVKNKGSARKVPIPHILNKKIDEWVENLKVDRLFSFPLNADGKAQNAASKRSMYYIRKVTQDKDLVAHSFRHTFKDLCRNADIPDDLHKFITGHSGGDVSSYYGEGHSLERRKEAIDKVNSFHEIGVIIK
jgi:integrase